MKTKAVTRVSVLTILLSISTIVIPHALQAKELSKPSYQETLAVSYGTGVISKNGKEESRQLWMDVFQPQEPQAIQASRAQTSAKSKTLRPAIILSFGGSFHQGGPRHTFRENGEDQDTSMGDYCRKFAAEGYTCFAIDYRLAPEIPILKEVVPDTMKLNERAVIGSLARINLIRKDLGLKLLDPKNPKDIALMSNSMSAAMADLNKAIEHIRKSASRYNIDPEKIVIGGFSAGAISSFAVAASGAPVKGVFLLSGASVLQSLDMSANSPNTLLIQGQNDLAGIQYSTPLMLSYFKNKGVQHSFAWVPSAGHFYKASSETLAGDGTKMMLEERILKFIKLTLEQ